MSRASTTADEGTPTTSTAIPSLLTAMAAGTAAVLVTLVGDAAVPASWLGRKLLVMAGGRVEGTLGAPAADAAARGEAERLLAGAGPVAKLLRVPLAEDESRALGIAVGATLELYAEVYLPTLSLVIIGAGHIGLALARMAKILGFAVTVVDDRANFANRERFPEADRVLAGPYEEALGSLDVTPATYLVLVTRGHRHDMECLKLVAERPAGYIGMIGSRRRVGAVLRTLEDEGYSPEKLRRIATPIGLDIGAETPEEIAVAILAEIIQYRRRGSPNPMSMSQTEHIPTFARRRRGGEREGSV